jgi:hypothetical protein
LLDFLHLRLHGSIDGDNIGTELSHLLLGLGEIRLQVIEATFQVLATGMGHEDKGPKMGRVGSNIFLKNYMYECGKGEELNPID